MANLKNRAKPGNPRKRYQVTVPRVPADPEEFARFAAELNRQLALIADELGRQPNLPRDFNPDDYVRQDEVEGIVNDFTTTTLELLSSQGESTAPPANAAGSDPTTDTGTDIDDGASAVEDAIPDAAPPPVATNSALGTTIDPPQFALEDHTHGGIRALRKNSAGMEFTRRRVNFIEGTGITITMVDDGVDDEVDLTLASSGDSGFRRHFLLMGA